ncbi:cilia- and flagella-associated protein 95 isoform X4 [Hyla sarda]|uniref:cilia- and flagella-associated protein 95 isoform X4 n=1 Tax=Hyla sarda TaxID=327740 RepID=UPI0024C2E72D|nr:cilia- and flagella-associated protein 95 isoform X4 [Hyla sarda]
MRIGWQSEEPMMSRHQTLQRKMELEEDMASGPDEEEKERQQRRCLLHQSREAEPKDYDVSEAPLGKKNLCYSTYRRLGNISNEDWNTTTEQQLSQVHLKGDYEVRDVHKKMVNEDNLDTLNLKRETGLPDSGFGAVLPHHSKDYNKMHLDTTYGVDYMAPLQYTSSLRLLRNRVPVICNKLLLRMAVCSVRILQEANYSSYILAASRQSFSEQITICVYMMFAHKG